MAKRPNNAGEASEQEPLLALVGSRIKAARLRAKLKQSDVATAIGTGQSYIVGVEAGETNITLRTLARVAVALGVSPMALLVDVEPTAGREEGTVAQLGQLLAAAVQDSDRVTDFLRQAHALVAGEGGKSGSDTPS
jgi:transcriptional regulator with XRE-family HTH domain